MQQNTKKKKTLSLGKKVKIYKCYSPNQTLKMFTFETWTAPHLRLATLADRPWSTGQSDLLG
jgi:hypothetical protein